MVTEGLQRGVARDALLRDEDRWLEVVDGQMVERRMTAGFTHALIVDNVLNALKPYVSQHQLGRVFGDGLTCILHEDAQGVQVARIPDVCFITREQRAHFSAHDPRGAFVGAPALVVEVVSPTERASTILGKIRDYLAYGSREVWVIYPLERRLLRYQPEPQAPTTHQAGENLTSALFPGLTLALDALFDEA